MKNFLFIILLVFSTVFGQTPVEQVFELNVSDHGYLTGFSKAISGQEMTYHSMSPCITSALLVRANNGKMVMEWETEPALFNKKIPTVNRIRNGINAALSFKKRTSDNCSIQYNELE